MTPSGRSEIHVDCHGGPKVPPGDLVTVPEVAKRAGIEYRTLHSWIECGVIEPARPSKGTGHPALLTERQAHICEMLQRLRRAGCEMDVLAGAARAAQHDPSLEVVELHRLGDVVITVPVVEPVRSKA